MGPRHSVVLMPEKACSIGCALINPKGEVAIVSKIHANGHISFSLPKGKPDKKEKPLETAKRETWEETGIPETRMSIHRLLANYKSYRMGSKGKPDKRRPRKIKIYGGYTDYTDDLVAQDTETHPDVYWVPVVDLEREEMVEFDDNEFHVENIKFFMDDTDRRKLEDMIPGLKKMKKREEKKLRKAA